MMELIRSHAVLEGFRSLKLGPQPVWPSVVSVSFIKTQPEHFSKKFRSQVHRENKFPRKCR